MDLQLRDKRALVSGSTAGIGFAAVARLAEEGASVIINGRSEERVEEAVRRVQERSREAEVFGVATDLGTAEGVDELVRRWRRPSVRGAQRAMDALVGEAGAALRGIRTAS
jgi:NAD(P)-dependent dehydrogenase (short-subunit alcohol dehydrogenase family)